MKMYAYDTELVFFCLNFSSSALVFCVPYALVYSAHFFHDCIKGIQAVRIEYFFLY